jgi:hypothetical protein
MSGDYNINHITIAFPRGVRSRGLGVEHVQKHSFQGKRSASSP